MPLRRDDRYLLGHGDQEIERLMRQGALAEHDTEAWMRDAGLGPGMHVLDIGSGLGDVAILAGRIVQPGGRVLGISDQLIQSLWLSSASPSPTSMFNSKSSTSILTNRSRSSTRWSVDSCFPI